jgi:hypothetical protein
MRFEARHLGSGLWGVYDPAVGGWLAVDIGEDQARQQAMDLDVVFDTYGRRGAADRREVRPPRDVDAATWQPAGTLDYWVRDRGQWWGRVRAADGHQVWILAGDLRPSTQD